MNEFGIVFENVSLKAFSSFKIGGNARYLIKPYDIDKLVDLLKYCKNNNIKYYILGNGTNVIIDDKDFDGAIIKLDNINDIIFNGNEVEAYSGVSLPLLVNTTLKKNFTSLSFASMIPGNIGGSIVGNAGAYGHELMQYVKEIKVLDQNYNIKILPKEDISFGYRYTSLKGKYIVLSVTFILEKGNVNDELLLINERNNKRKESQPIGTNNVGSIFRNPEGYVSGKLIDDLNLKGYRIGGAVISEKHANFIVNDNNATFNDVIELITFIKNKVRDFYNIDLVVEPNIIKWEEI